MQGMPSRYGAYNHGAGVPTLFGQRHGGKASSVFSQARQDVCFGRFSITEVEALLLASLTLQIEYGDYDAKKHQGGFLRDILQEYIPANIYRESRALPFESFEHLFFSCFDLKPLPNLGIKIYPDFKRKIPLKELDI